MTADELISMFKRSVLDDKPVPRSGLEPIPAHEKPCENEQHFPPNYICIPYGMQYRHTCPTCGHESVVRSSEVRFRA